MYKYMYYWPYPKYINIKGYLPYPLHWNNDWNMHPLHSYNRNNYIEFMDHGPNPYVVNMENVTTINDNFRTVLWTGKHLQVTLMSIQIGEDIGLEIHPDVDQFLRIEEGEGLVQMGNQREYLTFQRNIKEDDAVMVPAGTWHNIINTGNTPLKLYSIYAPPEHPHGTIHETKVEAMTAEEAFH